MGALGSKEAAPLTALQRREIVRLRTGGMELKEIARVLRCSYDQTQRCWLNSAIWKKKRDAAAGPEKRRKTAIEREAEKNRLKTEKELKGIAQRAADELKAEIAQAVREAASAPIYKSGILQW